MWVYLIILIAIVFIAGYLFMSMVTEVYNEVDELQMDEYENWQQKKDTDETTNEI